MPHGRKPEAVPVRCQKSAEVGRLSIGPLLAAYELPGCAAYKRQTDR